MLVLILTAAAGAAATVAWVLDRRRSRRRNGQGSCGACGVPWAEKGSQDSYLIHGRLVCEGCAGKARRRLPWELGALAGWVGLLTGIALTVVETSSAKDIAGIVAGSVGVALLGSVQWMKLANRSAQRRIAAGELLAFHALGPGVEPDARPMLGVGRNGKSDA